MQRTLGLDLGTSSVGWAVIDVPDGDDEIGAVLAMGSRIFASGAEVKGATVSTKAAERRFQRGMRRQVARRARRRRVLRSELAGVGLLPADEGSFEELMDSDPAALLARSERGERLSLHEVGRVVYWMASRRGFLSLRSGGSQLLGDDDEGFQPKRYRLSQYDPDTGERAVEGMEDCLIGFWAGQREHHPGVLTEQLLFGRRGRLKYPVRPISKPAFVSRSASLLDEFGVHGVVFFQRSVFWRDSTIGVCSLDPASRRVRAARADRVAQRFIVWQLAVNLRVGVDERPLDTKERERLVEALSSRKTMKFTTMRKVLGLAADTPVNFERGDRTEVDGNRTDAELAAKLKDNWARLSELQKDRLVHLLLGGSTEDQLRLMLRAEFGFDDQAVDQSMKATLPPGRMAYSRRTLQRLLPHMVSASTVRDAIEAAGFRRPEEVRTESAVVIDRITNPLVRTTLGQLAKLIDALEVRFERDGQPAFDMVRVELSRDVSNSRKDRERISKEQRQFERERERARQLIAEWAPGMENSSEYIRRVRLWDEQRETCLYTGRPIPVTKLFTNDVQIDHVLPRSKTLDNGMSNVVVVYTAANLDKGDRTVTEWRGEEFAAEVAERALLYKLGRRKVANLLTAHVSPDAIPAALLVQTGYINALARDVVRQRLGIEPQVSRGRLTRALLYQIGLAKDSSDHRRHALDAAMVALTVPSIANSLARQYKSHRDRGTDREGDFGAWEPWPGGRQALLDAFGMIVVSHKTYRKVSGQLHNETHYGKVTSPHRSEATLYAVRKPLVRLTRSQFEEIADPVVKEAVRANLTRRGIDPAAASLPFDPADLPTMPDGQTIRRVRLHRNMPGNRILHPADQPKTGVEIANIHGVYIYKNPDNGNLRIVPLERIDAFRDRDKPESHRRTSLARPGEEFLYSLGPGDTLASGDDTQPTLWVVRNFESVGRIGVLPATLSGSNLKRVRISAKRLRDERFRKLQVTPDGQLRRAHD